MLNEKKVFCVPLMEFFFLQLNSFYDLMMLFDEETTEMNLS